MSSTISGKNVYLISKYAITPDLGSATRQFYITKYLSKLGYNTLLISSRSSDIRKEIKFKGVFQKRTIENINHILINGPIIKLGFNIKRIISWLIFEINLFRYLKMNCKIKPEIVIVSSLSLLTIFNGLYLKRKFGSKLIFEVRDIWPLTLIEIGKFSKNNPLIRILSLVEKIAYTKSDIVVGTMPNLGEHISSITKKNVSFKYIPMGYDPEFYNDNVLKSKLPENLDSLIDGESFNVGYAGTIGQANLVEEIVDAAKILIENNNIHFYILGDGPHKEKITEMIKELQNITLLPRIDKCFVNAFLVKCQLLLHSVNNEKIYRFGLSPNKWIDYMYSSRPILVCYNGFQSIINEANCGKFISANEPELLAREILNFSQMPQEELAQLGINGMKYLIEKLSYESLANEYSKLF